MNISISDLVYQIQQSPELRDELLKALGVNPEPAPVSRFEMKTCPSFDRLTLLQATFFDNGPKDQRPKNTSQYVWTLEAWTDPADALRLSAWQWKGSVSLLTHTEFERRIKKLRSLGSISQEYYDRLYQIVLDFAPLHNHSMQSMFGLLSSKAKGTTYHEHQFLASYIDTYSGLPAALELVLGGSGRLIEHFDSMDMKGQQLKGKARRQARIDMCGFSSNWSTEP